MGEISLLANKTNKCFVAIWRKGIFPVFYDIYGNETTIIFIVCNIAFLCKYTNTGTFFGTAYSQLIAGFLHNPVKHEII